MDINGRMKKPVAFFNKLEREITWGVRVRPEIN
jgi:hypothetical protein